MQILFLYLLGIRSFLDLLTCTLRIILREHHGKESLLKMLPYMFVIITDLWTFSHLILRILMEGIVLLIWSNEDAYDQKKLDKVGVRDVEGTGGEGGFCRCFYCICS